MEKLVEGKDYRITNGILTIREGIRYIPPYSFHENMAVKSVVLPSTLTSIGEGAFEHCIGLTGELIIPDSVKIIDRYAFCNCRIHYLTIGKNVTYIGYFCFNSNIISSITNLSDKLLYIGRRAFFQSNDDHFTLRINSPKVYAEDDALAGAYRVRMENERNIININKLSTASYDNTESYKVINGTLIIGEGFEKIGDFSNAYGVERVEMPDSVIVVSNYAFSGLLSLKSAKFSNNLIVVGDNAFLQTSILESEVILPDSLVNIKPSSFSNCIGSNKVSIPNHAKLILYNEEDNRMEKYYIRREVESLLEGQKHILNIDKLIEADKKVLESVGLLPEVNDAAKQSKKVDQELSNIVRDSLIKYVTNDKYNEDACISLVNNILMSKEIDTNNMDETINYLFDKKQIKTIYLFMKYGYNYCNNSMISRAILNDVYDMIEVLLLLGVDINEIGPIGMTPLSIACQKGSISLVKYLIEKGASLDKVDSHNKKAIDYAKEYKNENIIELIDGFDNKESESQKDLDTLSMLLK